MTSCKVKNFDSFAVFKSPANHMNEVIQLQEKLDKKTYIDCKSKDIQSEPTSLSTSIRKIEHQNFQSVVKIENENQTNDTNENIFIDFDCKYMKLELQSSPTSICKTEYPSYPQVEKQENQIQTNCFKFCQRNEDFYNPISTLRISNNLS
ncbi:uncharacterized protein LOC106654430 [Trichogramma pretiosum]|uniref:uncharacterized protein LOC106654430 n=1 Tax=Trichogramma pretiosum TaxID=7493 RepID=UPI0006C97343|nr:uncharacterized protein LOC106654430 [Trichogramma pretiosum]XP_023319442.1 uncharacterized protein LOC106654430 [Trichogramma pretiosum]